MLRFIDYFPIAILIMINFAQSTNSELSSADNVKFIAVGFRHGNRNPAQFLPGDTSHDQWAWEGVGQQTNLGKRQAYSLGQFLRQRYDKVVPAEFYPAKVSAYSPSEGCLITLQVCMAGFFPPKGRAVWNPALLWTPVSSSQSNPLLRMALVDCPKYVEAYQAIDNDTNPMASAWLKRDPDLVNYIAKNSGLKPSLNDLADVADNIMNMKLFNATLPSWVTNPTLNGYPPKDIFTAVTSFAEAHQILCANNPDCARINAGLWLDQIIQTLQSIKNGTLKERVANFYAAHTETVLSLIRLVKADGIPTTNATAGFILEYTDIPVPSVRFIFHEPDPNNFENRLASVKVLPYCAGQEWCPLEKFIENVKGSSFSDWQAACDLPKCHA